MSYLPVVIACLIGMCFGQSFVLHAPGPDLPVCRQASFKMPADQYTFEAPRSAQQNRNYTVKETPQNWSFPLPGDIETLFGLGGVNITNGTYWMMFDSTQSGASIYGSLILGNSSWVSDPFSGWAYAIDLESTYLQDNNMYVTYYNAPWVAGIAGYLPDQQYTYSGPCGAFPSFSITARAIDAARALRACTPASNLTVSFASGYVTPCGNPDNVPSTFDVVPNSDGMYPCAMPPLTASKIGVALSFLANSKMWDEGIPKQYTYMNYTLITPLGNIFEDIGDVVGGIFGWSSRKSMAKYDQAINDLAAGQAKLGQTIVDLTKTVTDLAGLVRKETERVDFNGLAASATIQGLSLSMRIREYVMDNKNLAGMLSGVTYMQVLTQRADLTASDSQAAFSRLYAARMTQPGLVQADEPAVTSLQALALPYLQPGETISYPWLNGSLANVACRRVAYDGAKVFILFTVPICSNSTKPSVRSCLFTGPTTTSQGHTWVDSNRHEQDCKTSVINGQWQQMTTQVQETAHSEDGPCMSPHGHYSPVRPHSSLSEGMSLAQLSYEMAGTPVVMTSHFGDYVTGEAMITVHGPAAAHGFPASNLTPVVTTIGPCSYVVFVPPNVKTGITRTGAQAITLSNQSAIAVMNIGEIMTLTTGASSFVVSCSAQDMVSHLDIDDPLSIVSPGFYPVSSPDVPEFLHPEIGELPFRERIPNGVDIEEAERIIRDLTDQAEAAAAIAEKASKIHVSTASDNCWLFDISGCGAFRGFCYVMLDIIAFVGFFFLMFKAYQLAGSKASKAFTYSALPVKATAQWVVRTTSTTTTMTGSATTVYPEMSYSVSASPMGGAFIALICIGAVSAVATLCIVLIRAYLLRAARERERAMQVVPAQRVQRGTGFATGHATGPARPGARNAANAGGPTEKANGPGRAPEPARAEAAEEALHARTMNIDGIDQNPCDTNQDEPEMFEVREEPVYEEAMGNERPRRFAVRATGMQQKPHFDTFQSLVMIGLSLILLSTTVLAAGPGPQYDQYGNPISPSESTTTTITGTPGPTQHLETTTPDTTTTVPVTKINILSTSMFTTTPMPNLSDVSCMPLEGYEAHKSGEICCMRPVHVCSLAGIRHCDTIEQFYYVCNSIFCLALSGALLWILHRAFKSIAAAHVEGIRVKDLESINMSEDDVRSISKGTLSCHACTRRIPGFFSEFDLVTQTGIKKAYLPDTNLVGVLSCMNRDCATYGTPVALGEYLPQASKHAYVEAEPGSINFVATEEVNPGHPRLTLANRDYIKRRAAVVRPVPRAPQAPIGSSVKVLVGGILPVATALEYRSYTCGPADIGSTCCNAGDDITGFALWYSTVSFYVILFALAFIFRRHIRSGAMAIILVLYNRKASAQIYTLAVRENCSPRVFTDCSPVETFVYLGGWFVAVTVVICGTIILVALVKLACSMRRRNIWHQARTEVLEGLSKDAMAAIAQEFSAASSKLTAAVSSLNNRTGQG